MKGVLPSRFSLDVDPLACRPVAGPTELATHYRIRHAVFVTEQQLFSPDDRDRHDDELATVHVLGFVNTVAAGTVRLYPLGEGRWKGDRLAVLPGHRRSGIGGPLVRLAVATAGQRGGRQMDATVQAVHTAFFLSLGWTPIGSPAAHLGVPHQSMTIVL